MPITAVRCWFSVIPANVNYRLRLSGRVLAALPAIPLQDIPAGRQHPGFARQRHGTHVLLQGRQIAFERPCSIPRFASVTGLASAKSQRDSSRDSFSKAAKSRLSALASLASVTGLMSFQGRKSRLSASSFARQRHGTHVLLQGRQIAFERPCSIPRFARQRHGTHVLLSALAARPPNRV